MTPLNLEPLHDEVAAGISACGSGSRIPRNNLEGAQPGGQSDPCCALDIPGNPSCQMTGYSTNGLGNARESKLCTISSFTLVPHNLSFDGTDFTARVSRMLRLKKELAYHAHRVGVSLGRCSHVRVDVCRWCGQRRPQRSSQSAIA